MEYQPPRPIGDILRERNIEIVGADLATRHGFTQVPNFILTKADISVGAKLAYAMLLKYAWGDDACFPGQTKLASDMGSGERSVRRYLEELEKASLLEIVQRGLGKTNLYRLFLTVQKQSTRGRRAAAGRGLGRPGQRTAAVPKRFRLERPGRRLRHSRSACS